jgi:hypothetical protein
VNGLVRSSQNALRHGLLAKCAVLSNESHANFERLCEQFVARLAPADGVELGIVEEMVSAFWRTRRLWAIETRSLENALPDPDPDTDQTGRITAAFTRLAATPEMNLMHRYETRLHRIFQRALHNLLLLRQTLPNETLPNEPRPNEPRPNETLPNEPRPNEPRPNETLPNEPSPISEHPSAEERQ